MKSPSTSHETPKSTLTPQFGHSLKYLTDCFILTNTRKEGCLTKSTYSQQLYPLRSKTEAGKENWVDLHKDRLTNKTLQAKYWPDKKGKQKIESSKKVKFKLVLLVISLSQGTN